MDKGQLQVNLFDEITAEAETMGKKTTISDSLVSGSKAMDMLDLSRHSFEKIVESGAITPQIVSGKKYYEVDQLEAFMKTDTYNELLRGVVDPRNTLNDLTGKDWLPETKSFFYQKGLGANSSEAQIEKLHPAPYSFQDIGHQQKLAKSMVVFVQVSNYLNAGINSQYNALKLKLVLEQVHTTSLLTAILARNY